MELADVLADLKEFFREPMAATYEVVVTSDKWDNDSDRNEVKVVVAVDVDHEARRIVIYYED